MMKNDNAPTLSVCGTCPWRASVRAKNPRTKWYGITNIRRLWNGLRSGKTPGMVCHATDPESKEYGNAKAPPEGTEKQECAGALILIYREVDALNVMDYAAYRKSRKSPISRNALAELAWRSITAGLSKPMPKLVPCDDVKLPWEQECQTTNQN